MSAYMKETLASLPRHLQSLHTSFRNVQLPQSPHNYQIPPNLKGRASSIHAKNPRASLLFLIFVFLLFWKNIIYDVFSHIAARRAAPVDESNPSRNSTLGFQNIFVLSLPERGDRRAPVVAAADATGLTVTVLDAIRDRQIPQSDYPKWWGTNDWVPKEGELGCLMSHVRTWRKMIYENISSAIIMESDVDWDLRIRDSMEGLTGAAKAIADWPFDGSKHPKDISQDLSPYGDNWDFMWIGHCGAVADGNGRIYAFNDSSAPDEDHAWDYAGRPGEGHRPPGTRVVFQMRKTVCTTGYAMSLKGAHKFSKLFEEANSPIDLKIWSHCENDANLICLTIWPQIISMAESKSNIQHTGGGLSFGHEITEERMVAGNGIQISARVNAQKKTASDPSKWISEWKTGESKDDMERRMEAAEKERAKEEARNVEADAEAEDGVD